MSKTASGALLVRAMQDGTPMWEGKWRVDGGRQVKRRLGKAWLVADDGSNRSKRREVRFEGWLKRTGTPQDGYLTEEAAWTALREAQGEHEAQRAHGGPLMFEVVAAEWLQHCESVRGVKASTMHDYRSMLHEEDRAPRKRGKASRARIMRAFKGRPIASITERDVEAWLKKMELETGLSPRTINKHRGVLHGILVYALRYGYVGENVVTNVVKRREADPDELIVYSPEQVESVAREARDATIAALIRVAAYSGLRQGELLALRWRDVDFSASRIRVQRNYIAVTRETSTPKSRKSRSVPMASQVAAALAQLGQRAEYVAPKDLVFANVKGEHIDPSHVREQFIKARDRAITADADLPALRFHDLRHTFGSLAAASGVDIRTLQAYMGHASITTTMRYLHFVQSEGEAEKLSAAFGGTTATPSPVAEVA